MRAVKGGDGSFAVHVCSRGWMSKIKSTRQQRRLSLSIMQDEHTLVSFTRIVEKGQAGAEKRKVNFGPAASGSALNEDA